MVTGSIRETSLIVDTDDPTEGHERKMKKNERNCPQCRSTISKSAHLCKYCGKRFDDREIVEQPSQRPESDETGPISALGCFGLLIGGVMLFNHLTSGEGRTANSSSTTEATQPYADRGKQEAWIAAAQISVKKRLKDPSSAEFRNVHFYSGGKAAVACGEVNAKNSFGGYSGYERFVAAGSTNLVFLESDLGSKAEMTEVWKEMCIKAPTDQA
ncbi:hypothetical protein [Sphingopyxis terrae]|uniref:hypothetical protein n=1 Tax=Sphingopyxis terrae TaxID=33052 RepID=UPI0013C4B86A|nr:hypothetical protein [Sphingopyxis terrae]